MSVLTRDIQRSRRAEAASVSEMARSLSREARDAQGVGVSQRAGALQLACKRGVAGVARSTGTPARRRGQPGRSTHLMRRASVAGPA